MTPLRQRMIEDLQIRNRSPRTIKTYIAHVAHFAAFFRRSPELLGIDEIRAFQVHLIEAGASWPRFNQAVCALKFLYGITLHVAWSVTHIPYGQRPKKLPVILSQEEVVALLSAVAHPQYRVALMTAYGAGLRISELVALKPEHIDSDRMMLRVEMGKGKKDRLVPLSEVLLAELRHYWRHDRPQIKGNPWLFPGERRGMPLHVTTLQKACLLACEAAGLKKHVTPHTLRHAYATHSLEAGVDIRTLQELLGHSSVETTVLYTHVQRKLVGLAKSPLDTIEHFRRPTTPS